MGKFTFSRRWLLRSGEERVYNYHYPHRAAGVRCRHYLQKPGAALVSRGHAGLWMGANGIQFQNKTVQRLIALGFAEKVCDGGVVRRKQEPRP